MKFNSKINVLLVFIFSSSFSLPLFGDHHANSEFQHLFNGKDLENWDGDEQFWRVENGSIIGETTAEKQPADKKNTFLIYRKEEFSNFELRFKYKVEGFNSGIQYRSVDEGNWHVSGPQADFEARWHDGEVDKFSGMLFDEKGRKFLAKRGEVTIVRSNKQKPRKPKIEKAGTVGDPVELEKVIKRNDWNEYTIIANGNQLTHMINGQVMCVCFDEDKKKFRESGILAFQLHSGKPMKIEVKDILIRTLN